MWALLQKLFSDDFLSDEIKRRRREMFIVTDCTSYTVFRNEQNAMHFALSEGTRESAVYYKYSAATRLVRCAHTSGNRKEFCSKASERRGLLSPKLYLHRHRHLSPDFVARSFASCQQRVHRPKPR